MHKQIADAKHNMTYHKPQSPDVLARMDRLREDYQSLLNTISDTTPPGRDLAICLTKLEESLQSAIGAIARHPSDRPAGHV